MQMSMDYLSETYLFEFILKNIQDQIQENKLPVFQQYSSYPRIIKDLSFIVPKDITFRNWKR
jgi:phenylalanyl-tRNA synthetase beta subunit